MYSEFGQSFSLSMSTAQLCASEKDSNPLQTDSTPTSQVPSLEADKDASRREGTTEAEGEESSPVLLPPSSSSSCSSEQVGVEDEKEEKKKDGSGNSVDEVGVKEEKETDRGKDVGDDGDDDGYHTPTSPRHRIPEARVCPPAPKKPAHLLYMKRKARADQARRQVDDIEGEIGSFWSAQLDDAAPRTKKARGEATNA